jgi:hypothetical protein
MKLYLHTTGCTIEYSKVFKLADGDTSSLQDLADRFASVLQARHPGAAPESSAQLVNQNQQHVDGSLPARSFAQRFGDADLFVQCPRSTSTAAEASRPAASRRAAPQAAEAAATEESACKQRIADALGAAALLQLAERAVASGQLAQAVQLYEQVGRLRGCWAASPRQSTADGARRAAPGSASAPGQRKAAPAPRQPGPWCMQVLEQQPRSARALEALARIWLDAGKPGKAVLLARALAGLQAASYGAVQLLGECLWWVLPAAWWGLGARRPLPAACVLPCLRHSRSGKKPVACWGRLAGCGSGRQRSGPGPLLPCRLQRHWVSWRGGGAELPAGSRAGHTGEPGGRGDAPASRNCQPSLLPDPWLVQARGWGWGWDHSASGGGAPDRPCPPAPPGRRAPPQRPK